MTTERHEVRSFDGLRIPVWISGDGPPLLIVHGATSTHETWEPVRPYLEDHLTVAIMDRRSHLEDPSTPLSLDDEFRDVAAVAATLGDAVDLLGHSSGGVVAMGAALQMSNLRRLVVYEPPPPDLLGAEPGPEEMALAAQLGAQLRNDDVNGLMDTFWEAIIAPMATVPEHWQVVREDQLEYIRSFPRELGAISQCTSVRPDTVCNCAKPVLYLTGSRSGPAFRAWVEPLRQGGVDLQVAEIAGQEHLANSHAPDLVAQAVLDFVGVGASTP